MNELELRPEVPPLPSALVRHTPSLVLRRPEEGDLPALRELDRLPEMARFRAPRSAELTVVRFERIRRHWAERGYGPWAAVRAGEVVGFGGLSQKADIDGLNLGYQLHPTHWNKGYATEIAREAVRFGMEELRAPRLVGVVHVENRASARVLEKSGFALEGPRLFDGLPCLEYVMAGPR